MESNQSYWFVVREDQSNVIFSSNNFTIQNPQIVTGQEARYIVDTGDKQYVQVEGPVATHEVTHQCLNNETTQQKLQDTFWDTEKIKLLLTLSQQHKYKNNHHKDKVLWHLVAPMIGTTKEECNRKYWNLRRTYLRTLKWKKIGKDTKWPFFDLCQEIFKDYKPNLNKVKLDNWGEAKVKRLLTLYIENMHRLNNEECLQKDVWKEIASDLGTTQYNCYHKFKNLKRTFTIIQKKARGNNKIKWPFYHYFETISNHYYPKLDQWSTSKIRLLIDAYSSIAHKFNNPKYQKKDLWQQVSCVVGETPYACDRKYRNLKHSYVRIKKKLATGRVACNWKYYNDFEKIYDESNTGFRYTKDYIKQMLNYYIENKQKFMNPLIKKRKLWLGISSKLGMTPGECDKKFRNLKQTYVRLVRKGKGNSHWWPYFSDFQNIYADSNTKVNCKEDSLELAPVAEVRRVILNLQDKKQNEAFNKLVDAVEESNNIQRERNRILQELLRR